MGLFGFIFALLAAFELKHFLADYVLQGPYMLGKFKPGWDFLGPLSAHAGTHAICTVLIASLILPLNPWLCTGLAAFDFVTHFFIDRLKASPRYLGRWTPAQTAFWWSLGLDQALHHLAQFIIIATLACAWSRCPLWTCINPLH